MDFSEMDGRLPSVHFLRVYFIVTGGRCWNGLTKW